MAAALVNNSEFTVMVSDDKLVNHTVFPGQPFPKGVVVTNPLVVGSGGASAPPDPEPDDDAGFEVEDIDGDDVVEEQSDPPPQSGKGSGRLAWIKYASDNDLDYDDDWSRDEIVDDLRKQGIAVE